MHKFRFAATLPAAMVVGFASAEPVAAPTCTNVQAAFTSGPYDSREAIVDALQDHLKLSGLDKALGRDGKVQAIVLAVVRCDELGRGNFMTALDRSSAQVAAERARHRPQD